jgi:hypothetical protein
MKLKLFFAAITFLFLVSFVGNKKAENNTIISGSNKEQLLTGNAWKADEIRVQLSNNTTAYYKRGGKNNTVDYHHDFLKFNPDHSGTYVYNDNSYSTKWRFTDPEQTKMELLIYYPSPLEIHLEYINLTEKIFTYTQYVDDGRVEYLASGTRTPVACNTGDEMVIK